jgi:predicted transcriptional regulator
MNQKPPSLQIVGALRQSTQTYKIHYRVVVLNLADIRDSFRVQRQARTVPRDPTFKQLCAGAPKPNRQLPSFVARRPTEALWMILDLKHHDESNQKSNIQVFRGLNFEEKRAQNYVASLLKQGKSNDKRRSKERTTVVGNNRQVYGDQTSVNEPVTMHAVGPCRDIR